VVIAVSDGLGWIMDSGIVFCNFFEDAPDCGLFVVFHGTGGERPDPTYLHSTVWRVWSPDPMDLK